MSKFLKYTKNYFLKIVELIKKERNLILDLVFLSMVIISIVFVSNETRMQWIFGIVSLYVIIRFLKYIYNSFESENKFIPKQRYTKKDAYGNIYIDEDKIHQAIIYLSYLEDNQDERYR